MEKLNITSSVLDKLGFSEYWDENGDWGGRTLTFRNGTQFRIIEQEENDDESYGYGTPKYVSNHYYFAGWFAVPQIRHSINYDLFFLHEMYECIKNEYPDCLEEFTDRCEELNMKSYIACS